MLHPRPHVKALVCAEIFRGESNGAARRRLLPLLLAGPWTRELVSCDLIPQKLVSCRHSGKESLEFIS